MEKYELVILGGIAVAIVLFFLTPFIPYDDLGVLIITIIYGLIKLFK